MTFTIVVQYVDTAAGMSISIGDKVACVFAIQFYSAIGFGHSLQIAFRQAIAQLTLEGIKETPKTVCPKGLDANDIELVQSLGDV